MEVKTYKGLGYWTPSGYWRFPIGSREGFEQLLMEQAEDGPKAIKEWNALRDRLKTLGGSTTAVALLNLRQDLGFLSTTAGALPFVATHPDVFADLPLTFDDLSKTVDEIVTVPFLRLTSPLRWLNPFASLTSPRAVCLSKTLKSRWRPSP